MELFSIIIILAVMFYAIGSLIISNKSIKAIQSDDDIRLRKLERLEKLYKNVGTTVLLLMTNVMYITGAESNLILGALLIIFTLMVIVANAVFDYGTYFKKRIVSPKVNLAILFLGGLGVLAIIVIDVFIHH